MSKLEHNIASASTSSVKSLSNQYFNLTSKATTNTQSKIKKSDTR